MGTRIEGYRECLDKALNDKNQPWTSAFDWAEGKTGIKRLYLFTVLIIVLGLYMVFGYAAQLLCNIIGFLYPAYRSMKALESPNKDDDTKWLTYWAVFALFSIIEYFSDILIYWFPFYWLIKCLFHIWCFVPLENNGSIIIYNNVIRPWFLKHQEKVDNILDDIAGSAAKLAAQNVFKSD
ncbi:receptor expression-enhancing protein 5-like [Zootermopsis nevadensis]|uniref:Receptor expression-enhancing protein n=1 Tax=Zootermopsis nevadensis TaxID=136037 RepID=A0A067RUB6_ZOONE|nr:receptor expression-enhancing protein 5-like [Zootermopsis nevadensis]XP_021935398.1 receptor expression-enhancing protein 5-like [Zootermopsis nevadensis]KDR23434.1 Receptor expression-enhancing protein 5 [Zootermopsis nevadensis]